MVIDTHSHILPGVDDGAVSLEEALAMAQMAVDCGVFHMIATPHYHYYGHDSGAQIRTAYAQLQDGLEYEQIPLQLSLAMENIAVTELPDLLQQGQALTYPDSPYFLVEFQFDESPAQMEHILSRCAQAGFLPVIAHPERYLAILDDPGIAAGWTERGWGVQINRDSLLGVFGRQCMECAHFMLSKGWANCIASDAHGAQSRNTDWTKAWYALQQQYPHKLLEQWLEVNPLKILRGDSLKD